MTTDLYATVLFQDGQQLTFDDVNNMQRLGCARLTDQILESMIGSVSNAATRPDFPGDDLPDVSTLWAYCVHPGAAHLRKGTANNKVQIGPGTLLQKISSSNGSDSSLLPFTFDGTAEFTLTNGDATNPRVDLLQIALVFITDTPTSIDFQDATTRALTTNPSAPTRRRIQCTLSVKQGTPAASPTIPDPDAGCVPVGMVMVGNGYVTSTVPQYGLEVAATGNACVYDQRMPIGVRQHRLDPILYKTELAWSLTNSNSTITSSSATNTAIIAVPTRTGRLLGVVITQPSGSGIGVVGTVSVGAMNALNTAPSTATSIGNTMARNAASGTTFVSARIDFEHNHTPSAGPTIQQSAIAGYGVPMWTWGLRVAGSGLGVPARDESCVLIIKNAASGTVIGPAFVNVAGL